MAETQSRHCCTRASICKCEKHNLNLVYTVFVIKTLSLSHTHVQYLQQHGQYRHRSLYIMRDISIPSIPTRHFCNTRSFYAILRPPFRNKSAKITLFS